MVAHNVLECRNFCEILKEGIPVPLNDLVEQVVHHASAVMNHLLDQQICPLHTSDLVLLDRLQRKPCVIQALLNVFEPE